MSQHASGAAISPPLSWGMIRVFALAFHPEWLPTLRWPGTCTNFPTKSDYDIIRTSSGDVPMMWCILDDDIYVTRYVKVGGIKAWKPGGNGFPVLKFLVPSCTFWGCRAHTVSLIASRVLGCAPTSGQPGILHLLTTEMCWVHWLLSVSIFCNPALVFIDLSCLCDHQANGPSKSS